MVVVVVVVDVVVVVVVVVVVGSVLQLVLVRSHVSECGAIAGSWQGQSDGQGFETRVQAAGSAPSLCQIHCWSQGWVVLVVVLVDVVVVV